ncbi:MAG: CbiX/SirB N-terminal domain-containing protein [Caldimonas sp.]
MRAMVLFAHGARDARWAEPFQAVAGRVRAGDPSLRVALAFLEMMQPDLAAAIDGLAAEGAERIDVVPLFLGTGGHLRKDLPPLVAAAQAAHPRLVIRLHAAIGEHPAVAEAMAGAALELARSGE